jgi:cytochrome c-type biogenesis protein CcmH/NrfG
MTSQARTARRPAALDRPLVLEEQTCEALLAIARGAEGPAACALAPDAPWQELLDVLPPRDAARLADVLAALERCGPSGGAGQRDGDLSKITERLDELARRTTRHAEQLGPLRGEVEAVTRSQRQVIGATKQAHVRVQKQLQRALRRLEERAAALERRERRHFVVSTALAFVVIACLVAVLISAGLAGGSAG